MIWEVGNTVESFLQAYFILLHFTDTVFFYKLKVCGNPASSESISAIFPTSLAHVSLSHFGNSHNISDFFVTSLFVIVTYYQWSLMFLLSLFGMP